MADNPLLTSTLDVPFDRITAAHVQPAVEKLLGEADARIDDLVAYLTSLRVPEDQ